MGINVCQQAVKCREIPRGFAQFAPTVMMDAAISSNIFDNAIEQQSDK